jgi:hypothetical protein
LHELVPQAARFVALVNPTSSFMLIVSPVTAQTTLKVSTDFSIATTILGRARPASGLMRFASPQNAL